MDVTLAVTQLDKLEILKAALAKYRILDITDVCKILNVSSRMSAHRYLKRLDYIVSYSHGGKYYALREAVEFDQYGLWHCGDVGFSIRGTLLDTIVHIVTESEAGKTNDELTKQFRLRLQNPLLQLVREKRIIREKLQNVYLYINSESIKGQHQLKTRKAGTNGKPLPEWVVIDVLIETIRASNEAVDAEKIAACLHKWGSSISLDQIRQVFQAHSLEKKMLDSML